MKSQILDLINSCQTLKEYIINSYLYLDDNLASIQGILETGFQVLDKKAHSIQLELSLLDNHEILEFFKSRPISNNKDILINLLAINKYLSQSEQIKSYLDSHQSIECNNKKYFLLSPPAEPIANSILNKPKKIGEISTKLDHYFKNFIVAESSLKGYDCKMVELDKLCFVSNNLFYNAIQSKQLNTGIFSNVSRPDFLQEIYNNEESDKTLIYFSSINNENELIREINLVLDYCYKENIGIVVLPELFVYQKTRDFISQWLIDNNDESRIIMVIAGSMHIFDAINNTCINESIVYNSLGERIWSQNKINAFRDGKLQEYIYYEPRGFLCVNSVIGRMSISICADFISDSYPLLNKEYSVNINLVPALTIGTQRFENFASDMGSQNYAVTFCVNTIDKDNKKPLEKGFIYAPIANKNKGFYENLELHKDSKFYYRIVNLFDLK